MTISRSYSLGSSEFNLVFSQGKRFRSKDFRAVFLEKQTQPKLGISVKKKFYKRAVDRNKVKRILKLSFQQYLPQLDGIHIAITVGPHLDVTNRVQLWQACEAFWLSFLNSLKRL